MRIQDAMGGDLLEDHYGGEWVVLDRGAITKHEDGLWYAYAARDLHDANDSFGPFVKREPEVKAQSLVIGQSRLRAALRR